jgi:hypothetical protein
VKHSFRKPKITVEPLPRKPNVIVETLFEKLLEPPMNNTNPMQIVKGHAAIKSSQMDACTLNKFGTEPLS